MLPRRLTARIVTTAVVLLAGLLPASRVLSASSAVSAPVTVPLEWPTMIALDQHGNSFVVSLGQCGLFNAVTELSPTGQVLSRLELPFGTAPGDARMISGIAVDADDDVFISDLLNNRVEEFSRGRFVAVWGDQGRGKGSFVNPEGLAFDRQGDLYVLDSSSTRVVKLAADGHVVAAYGVGASGEPGIPLPALIRASPASSFELLFLISFISGLAVAPDGTIYVPSFGTVRRISSSGAPLPPLTFNGPDGTVFSPRQVTSDTQGNLFLIGGFEKISPNGSASVQISAGANAGPVIIKAAPSGRILKELDLGNSSGASIPVTGGIAVDGQGRLHVTSTTTYSIYVLTPDGRVASFWQNPDNPTLFQGSRTFITSVTLGPRGRIYVGGAGEGGETLVVRAPGGRVVQRLHLRERSTTVISSGGGFGVTLGPGAGVIAVGPGGNIYSADAANNALVQYSLRGVETHRWKLPRLHAPIPEITRLQPQGVAADPAGRVYVVGWNGSRDVLFRLDRTRGTWTHIPTPRVKQFGAPITDRRGTIFLAADHKVVALSPRGRIVGTLSAPEVCAGDRFTPVALAIGGRGNVFAADAWPVSQVVKFGPHGKVLARWGHRGFERGEFDFELTAGVAVDHRGRVYVADGAPRVQVLSPAGHVVAIWHG